MEKRSCYKCQKNKTNGKGRNIYFRYQDMQIRIFKVGGLCVSCAKTEWIENFEKNAQEFVNIFKGKPKVDWRRYHESFAMKHFDNMEERFYDLLLDIRILSHQAEGNWEIVADGPIGLNPRAYMSYLFFTSKQDVIEFACLEYSNTMYGWEIRHIDKVISKKDII